MLLKYFRVCCDAPSSSSHPLDGILEDTYYDCLWTGGGWMAETFVRAPVTLTLHLPAPAMLATLSWDTRLGSQADNNHFLTQCWYIYGMMVSTSFAEMSWFESGGCDVSRPASCTRCG